MNLTVGIDVGCSNTKVCAMTPDRRLLSPLKFKPTASRAEIPTEAFERFLSVSSLSRADISRIAVTGAGASFTESSLGGIPCETVGEFDALAKGGLYLSGLSRALVVSMGTGTATVYAERDGKAEYQGGTGLGGGTVLGLSRLLLGTDNVREVLALASEGDLTKIDLRIRDVVSEGLPTLPEDLTVSNFAKAPADADPRDVALGILNTVCEAVAMVALFAARGKDTKDIVLTGNLVCNDVVAERFTVLSEMFGVSFIVPENAGFAVAAGAALG